MQKNIDLSIIVPIYNVEKYLKECLESIYCLNINKEILLINDGSTDNSLEIAYEFAKKYQEDTVLISKKNGGLSSARNAGLRKARGKYVYFIDSDDYILSREFESFFLETEGMELDILQGRGRFFGNVEEAPIQNLPEEGITEIMIGKEYIYRMLDQDCYVDYVWLNIYRRDYLLANNFFFVEGITFEDIVFSPPVFWQAKKIKQSKYDFYRYRIRDNSITQQSKKAVDHLYVYNFLLDYSLEQRIYHARLTRLITSRFRKLAKEEKVFNQEIYKKLWKLPKKNRISFRNLLDLSWRRYFCQNILMEVIEKKGKK